MNKENLDILDILTILSFIISIENLKENQMQSESIRKILQELNEHLNQQDIILKNQDDILYKIKGRDKVES